MAQKQPMSGAELSTLGVAMLQGGGATDPEVASFLKSLLADQMKLRQKEAERKERQDASAMQSIAEVTRIREAEQARCNHRKQDNRETRLMGQRVSGTGQIVLTCGFCYALFHHPALAGQKPVPSMDLFPSPDVIGG